LIKSLHIVSFNVPYPPDYGGVIDVFYKIKALKECGVNVILHCYKYGRKDALELKNICSEIYYYKRKKLASSALKKLPFIVATRNSELLLKRLQNDNLPILFEGLHTTFWLEELCKTNRKIFVRAHNVEHQYYRGLAKAESNVFKKMFFKSESRKLYKYESTLRNASKIFSISQNDHQHFNLKYGNSILISAFHPYQKLDIKEGRGDYVLFHGDLSVSDNIKSAVFLIENIFNNINIPFIIAGKNPDIKIVKAIKCIKNNNVQLISNPVHNKMNELISNAHINLLYSFQSSGIKLKLINSLYCGRHCIVNNNIIENTGLKELCYISNNVENLKKQVLNLFNISFNNNDIAHRKAILSDKFDVKANALKLCDLIF